MEQIYETIDSARDYRGALMADYLRRAWAALTHGASNHGIERNSLPRPASNSVSQAQR
jgi:hypothetical protein